MIICHITGNGSYCHITALITNCCTWYMYSKMPQQIMTLLFSSSMIKSELSTRAATNIRTMSAMPAIDSVFTDLKL